jgi:hypothetical protein
VPPAVDSSGARRFGPNGDVVERLLDLIAHFDITELGALTAAAGGSAASTASDPLSGDPKARARALLRSVARRSGRLASIAAVNDELTRWATSVHQWLPAGVIGTSQARADIEPRSAAIPAILDAVYAALLADLLDDGTYVLLTAPWREVVGPIFEEDRAAARDTIEGDRPAPRAGDDANGPAAASRPALTPESGGGAPTSRRRRPGPFRRPRSPG